MSRQDNIENLIRKHTNRLQKLKEQKAEFGINTPPHVLTEMEEIETQIAVLQAELKEIRKSKIFSEKVITAFDRCIEQGRDRILKTVPEHHHKAANTQLDALQEAFFANPLDLKTIRSVLEFFSHNSNTVTQVKLLLQDPVLQRLARRCGDQIVEIYERLAFGWLKGIK